MLKTKVILSHVTNLSDARYAAGMGVDFIGFSLNSESDYYVTYSDVNTIRDWLSGVSIIGEVSSMEDTDEYNIDYVQIDNIDEVANFDEPILKVELNNANLAKIGTLLNSNMSKVAFFILDLSKIDLAEHFQALKAICASFNCYISTSITPDNLSKVLELSPQGIVLQGSQETKPGLSSYDGIADILELLEED